MKQYIRVDKSNNVILGFSDLFKQPLETDIEYGELKQGHFCLFGAENPNLANELGIYLYKYVNNEVIKKTEQEIQLEIDNLPPAPQVPMPKETEVLYGAVDEVFRILSDSMDFNMLLMMKIEALEVKGE